MPVTVGKLGIIRLSGDDLTALRTDCFVRDKFRCQECLRPVSPLAPEWADSRAHMAHIVGRGAGGSDTLENVRTLCREHHSEGEHNPKSVRSKS
jgi:5-methylcytosine-specific restriction endonuclease McrA